MRDDSRQPATGYPVCPCPLPHRNGYSQQPSYAYRHQQQPNPNLYNNDQDQPPPCGDSGDGKCSVCERRVSFGMMLVFTVISVSFLITLVVLRPKLPEFRVVSGTVTGLNASGSGAWDFRVTVSNPNKKAHIVFDEVNSDLTRGGFFIADNTLAPFTVGKRNASKIRVSFATSEAYVSDETAQALIRDRSDDGVVGFDVTIRSRIQFDVAIWKASRRVLKVSCVDVKIPIGRIGSGNMTGGANRCTADWSFF